MMRFSLRTVLICIGVLGVLLGVFPRVWRHDPEMAIQLVRRSVLVVGFAHTAFIWTFVCSKRVRERYAGLLIASTGLYLVVLIGTRLLAFDGAQGKKNRLKWLPTSHLVTRRIEKNIHDREAWKELERRVLTSSVKNQELEPAFAKLVEFWKAESKREDKTPTMSPFPLGPTDLLHQAATHKLISDELLAELADLRFGKPIVKNGVRLREEPSFIEVNKVVEYRRRHQSRTRFWSPWILVWHVEAAMLDDKPLAVLDEQTWYSGRVSVDATRGNHELELTLACGYVSRDDLSNSRLNAIYGGSGFMGGPAARRLWPKTKKTWKTKVNVPVQVFRNNEEMISLVADEKLNPTSKLRFERLSELKIKDRPSEPYRLTIGTYMILDDAIELPIAMSYDIFIVDGENRIPVGGWSAHETKDDVLTHRWRSDLPSKLDRSEHRTVTLEFIPNPQHLEKYTEVTEIWGRPLIMKDLTPWKRGPIYVEKTSR